MKTRLAILMLCLGAMAFAQDTADAQRKRVVTTAYRYRGVPYVYGAMSPAAFDCSGFVCYVYREALGMELPRSAKTYYSVGTVIDARRARPGDVFVFDTVGGRPSHVALYVGDGKVIHAVSAGRVTGVIESPLTDRYWGPRVIGVRSYIADSPAPAAPIAAAPAASAAAAVPATPASPVAAAPAAPVAPPATAVKPAAPLPAAAAVTVVSEESLQAGEPVADVGVSIPAVKSSFTDRIPTAAGTNVVFTLTNDTGSAGVFMVLFFRIDPKSYKYEKIHEERVELAAGDAFSLPVCRFDAMGKYKLIVKRSGDQLFERVFEVIGR